MAQEKAGFVTLAANTDFPADAAGKKIGVLDAQAFTTYFQSQMGAAPLAFNVMEDELTVIKEATKLWEALEDGSVDAVYTGQSEANEYVGSNSDYAFMHGAAGWSQGVAYGCRPEFGDAVTKLNEGLRKFKETSEYTDLCSKYSLSVKCDGCTMVVVGNSSTAAPSTALSGAGIDAAFSPLVSVLAAATAAAAILSAGSN